MHNITAKEIEDRGSKQFEDLSEPIQKQLLKRECVKCGEGIRSNIFINYVLCSNGKVVWWHTSCQTVYGDVNKKGD